METLRCPRCGDTTLSGGPLGDPKARSLITESYQVGVFCSRCGEIPLLELPLPLRSRIERQRFKLMLILLALVLVVFLLMFLKQQGFIPSSR